jgi:hypothetical protein
MLPIYIIKQGNKFRLVRGPHVYVVSRKPTDPQWVGKWVAVADIEKGWSADFTDSETRLLHPLLEKREERNKRASKGRVYAPQSEDGKLLVKARDALKADWRGLSAATGIDGSLISKAVNDKQPLTEGQRAKVTQAILDAEALATHA